MCFQLTPWLPEPTIHSSISDFEMLNKLGSFMMVRSIKNRLIKLAIQFGCALIVMVLIISGMEKPRLPLKIEIRAKISQDDVWQLTYEDTARLKKKREKTIPIKVSRPHTFQTISFRLRYKTRLKNFKLSFGLQPRDIDILYIRLKSRVSQYKWRAQEIPGSFAAYNTDLNLNSSILTVRARKPGNPAALSMEKDISDIYQALMDSTIEKILHQLPAIFIALLVFLLLNRIVPQNFSHSFTRIKQELKKIIKSGNYFKYILSVIFVISIFLPFFLPGNREGSLIDNAEKRSLAKNPTFNSDDLWNFPGKYENYFNDHFGLRNLLINWNNLLDIKLYKISPIPKVIIGKDGWLFYRSELAEDGNTIEDYQGRVLFTPGELQRIRENIELKANWCRQRGIYFLIVLVPNKETVYSEYMPAFIKRGKKTRLEQINAMSISDPKLPILNLTEALISRKKEKQLYYKGGTHWNQYGAYYGYQAIMRRLSRKFPDLKPLPLGAFDEAFNKHSKVDHWFGFNEHREIILTLKASAAVELKPIKRRKVFIFRDSFIKYYPHFYQVHFKPFVQLSNRRFDPGFIEKGKPGIVIWEIVERASDILLN
jgi:hypothetical protein